jgi:hypothetical protein
MDYNNLFEYKDGHLYYKVNVIGGNNLKGKRVGTLRNDGYIGIFIDKKYYFEHRLIWTIFNGEIPSGYYIDHINNDRADNRVENLRLCTTRENAYNRGPQANNKSGFKGVSWHKQKQKWVAQIKIDGKNKFLGFFEDKEEAYQKYCEKAIETHGEFAKL